MEENRKITYDPTIKDIYNAVGIPEKKVTESELEDLIIANIHLIAENNEWPKIRHVKRQYRLTHYQRFWRLDILLIHVDNSATIIEVKRGRSANHRCLNVIGQALNYHTIVSETIPDTRVVIATYGFEPSVYNVIKKSFLAIDLLCFNDKKVFYIPGGRWEVLDEVQ